MIRKLTEEDNNILMKLITEEPEFNVYVIGDIENFGYNKSFLDYFGEYDEEGILIAVLVRYFNIFTLYAKDIFDVDGFFNIIKSYDKFGMLIGKTEIVSQLEKTTLGLNNTAKL